MKFTHKIFHLDKDTDRNFGYQKANDALKYFSSEFNSPTIEISCREDFEDFINKNLDFNVDKNGYNLHNQQGWKWGELGIWASNWLAWNKFLQSDYDYLILMEDDILIYPSFRELLEEYMQQLPNNWEIFHYFVPADQHGKYNVRLDVSADLCRCYQDWSCLCYIINKDGAKKLIETSAQGITLPLDWHMFRQTYKFNMYTIKPFSEYGCTLESLDSTFQNKEDRKVI